MATAENLISLRQGQYLLLEAELPGRSAEVIGILLYDAPENRLGCRLRRDWRSIANEEEDLEVFELMEQDLQHKIDELGPERLLHYLESDLSNTLRVSGRETTVFEDFGKALNRLYRQHVPAKVQPWVTHLPVYTLRAAAGRLSESQTVEPEGWLEAPPDMRLREGMFAAHITGRSMEPRIPDGSLCAFRHGVVGSREGKLLLIENHAESEAGGQRYTIKRYRSRKVENPDETWRHERIWLEPLNPAFKTWELWPNEFQVIAEFVRVLE